MIQTLSDVAAVCGAIMSAPRQARRRVVAIAGAPGSGKSTLAEQIAAGLTASDCLAQVVPMDGFHLDNRVIAPLGLLDRKGAPETFDVGGFARLLTATATDPCVYYPLFDRTRDIAVAGAGCLDEACETVIVEGNYLLLDAPGWRDLGVYWDLRIRLDVPIPVLRARLVQRWLDAGLGRDAAEARADGNDLRNAHLVTTQSVPADILFTQMPGQT